MKESNKEKVIKAITKALKLKKQACETDSIKTIEEWDSLGHLVVLTALDKMFRNRVAGIKDMAGASSIKQILKILEREKLI